MEQNLNIQDWKLMESHEESVTSHRSSLRVRNILRLGLSKGSNWVGVFYLLHLTTETSRFRNVVIILPRTPDDGKCPKIQQFYENFLAFHQSEQTYSSRVDWNMPRPLPSTSFPTHHALFALPFGVLYFEPLMASLNKSRTHVHTHTHTYNI
jgi:hypothetical protein